MIGQGVGSESVYLLVPRHHASSGSSLLFLTMAEKTSFDSGLSGLGLVISQQTVFTDRQWVRRISLLTVSHVSHSVSQSGVHVH